MTTRILLYTNNYNLWQVIMEVFKGNILLELLGKGVSIGRITSLTFVNPCEAVNQHKQISSIILKT